MLRVLPVLLCLLGNHPVWSQSAEPLDHVNRVFVDSFGAKAEEQQVRQAVIDELRRRAKPSVVDSSAQADAVLTGSGEIWVKGYFSLNPRARSVGEDAHPVYGGYLSVELRGAHGDVLWSYLVTPRRYGSEPVPRALAAQIVKKLREALTH